MQSISIPLRSSLLHRSRSKPEIQSLVPFIRCSLQIIHPLFSAHAIPDAISLIILRDVIPLCENEDEYVPCHYTQQSLVASVVVGLVVIAVDL